MRILLTTHAYPPRSCGGAENYCRQLARGLADRGHEVRVLSAAVAPSRAVVDEVVDGLRCTFVEKPFDPHEQVFARADGTAAAAFDRLLESFRPHLVHINHLGHLSLDLPQRAARSGAAVVATLHDHWLHCPTSHMLQYGRQRCSGPGLWKCARCTRWCYTRIRPTPATASQLVRIARAILRRIAACWELPGGVLRHRLRRREVTEALRHIDRLICPSRYLLEFSRRCGAPEAKLVFLRHGLPPSLFAATGGRGAPPKAPIGESIEKPFEKPIGELTEQPPKAAHDERHSHGRDSRDDRRRLRFGFVGSFNAVKGIEVLLRAFDGLDGVELILYGRDSENRLAEFSHVIAQGHVSHRGFLPDDRKAEALAELDCLVVPSTCYENSPLVIQEAFAAGVPVLASNIGGMAELVRPGAGGWQFAVGDWRDLRRSVEALRDGPQMIAEARRTIPAVPTLPEHVARLESIFAEAIAARSAAAAAPLSPLPECCRPRKSSTRWAESAERT